MRTEGQNACKILRLHFKKDFKSVYSLHGMEDNSFLTINGKNEIYARVCTAAQINQYGYEDCLHVKAGLALKKGKFVPVSLKTYEILGTSEEGEILIRFKKNVTLYTQMGGKKKSFIMKTGEKFPPRVIIVLKTKKPISR